MSEISNQVANRIKWARFVLASHRIHAPAVEQTLAELYDPVAGYSGEQMAKTMGALATRLEEVTRVMEKSELALAAELADDTAVRDRRDEALETLRERLLQGRSLVESAFGRKVAESYGLAQPLPRQADALLAFAGNVVNLLAANPVAETDVFGNAIDTTRIAAILEQTRDELAQTLEALDTETREAHTARAERDEVLEEWTQVYRGTAVVLSGFYRLAGRDDLAHRVRPTVRRSVGKTEPPEDVDAALEDVEEPSVDDVVDVEEPAEV